MTKNNHVYIDTPISRLNDYCQRRENRISMGRLRAHTGNLTLCIGMVPDDKRHEFRYSKWGR